MYCLDRSPDHFPVSELITDFQDNKVVALVNLRTLYHCIEDYYTDHFQTAIELLSSDLNLPDLAHNPASSKFLPLLSLILAIAVQCRNKQTYISKMWSLPEGVQSQLMSFIQRVLEKFNETGTEPQGDIVTAVRREKRRLRADFDVLKAELISTYKKLEEIAGERNNFKGKLTDLQGEIMRKASPRQSSDVQSLLKLEYESQLAAKSFTIEDMRRQMTQLAAKAAAELRQVRDESDSKTERINQFTDMQITLEKYKKKLEDQTELKRQMKEMKLSLEESERIVEKLKKNEASFDQLKVSWNVLKEQLKSEKENADRLQTNLTEKEELLVKYVKSATELKERNDFLAKRTAALSSELDTLQAEVTKGLDRVDSSHYLQKDLEAGFAEMVQSLQSENAELQSRRGEEELIQHFNDMLDSALFDKQQAEAKCSALLQENAEIVQKLGIMEAKVKTREQELAELMASKREMERKLKSDSGLKDEIERLQTKVLRLTRESEELEKNRSSLMSIIQGQNGRIQSLESKLEQLPSRIQAKPAESGVETEPPQTSKSEPLENHFQTLKILELDRELTRVKEEASALASFLTDRDAIITMLKTEHEAWVKAFLSQAEESKSQLRKELEGKLASEEQENRDLNERLTSLKATHDGLIAEWRREERLLSMVIHNMGLEMSQRPCRHK